MRGEPGRSVVLVEWIDEDPDSFGVIDVIEPSSDEMARGPMVVAGAAVIVLAAALSLMARYGDGPTATDDVTSAPTTTVAGLPETRADESRTAGVAPTVSTTSRAPGVFDGYERVEFEVQLREVIPTDDGWIARSSRIPRSSQTADVPSTLFESNDGLTWDRLETNLPNGDVVDLALVDGSLLSVVSDESATVSLWQSPDGRSWTEALRIEPGFGVEFADSSKGGTVIAGQVTGAQIPIAGLNDYLSTKFELHVTEPICAIDRASGPSAVYLFESCAGSLVAEISDSEVDEVGAGACISLFGQHTPTRSVVIQLSPTGESVHHDIDVDHRVTSVRSAGDRALVTTTARQPLTTGTGGRLLCDSAADLGTGSRLLALGPSAGEEDEVLVERATGEELILRAGPRGGTFLNEGGRRLWMTVDEPAEFVPLTTSPRSGVRLHAQPYSDWVIGRGPGSGVFYRTTSGIAWGQILLHDDAVPMFIADDALIVSEIVDNQRWLVKVPLP